MFQEKGKKKG